MGNKVGWILAGALLVVVALILLFTVVIPRPASPTAATSKKGFLELKTVGIMPEEIIGWSPSGQGNAADHYHKAVEVYHASEEEIDRAVAAADLPGMVLSRKLEEIHGHVAAGARERRMRYTLLHAPKELKVGFGYEADPADSLVMVSHGLLLLVKKHASKRNLVEAEQVLQHGFMLGWHMMDERGRPYMVMRGMDIQDQFLLSLAELYKDSPERKGRVGVLERYLIGLRDLAAFYESKAATVWNTRPNPGDIFNVIENDEDRAWRVQGLLALGIVKFSAQRSGDRRYARKLMEAYVEGDDRDALEAAAALAAKNLTKTEFNTLGTGR